MKRYILKKTIGFILFVVAVLVCEVITFHMLGFGLFPRVALFPFAFTLIVASIIFLIPGRIAPIVLYSVVLVIMCTLSVTNIILFRIHGDLFTIDLLALMSEAQAAMEGGFVIDVTIAIPFVVLIIVSIALQIVFLRLIKEHKATAKANYRRNSALVLAGVAVVIGGAGFLASVLQIGGLSQSKENNVFGISTRENFDEFKFKVPFFRDFGSFALIYRNVIMQTSPGAGMIPSRTLEDSRKFFSGEEGDFEDFTGCFFGVACDDGEECVDPLHWAPDEGNNVIVIMLESFEDFMLHPEFTPALYNLRRKSVNFNNFHGNHKTDFSEASVILGSYPMNVDVVSGWNDAGDTRNPNLTQEFPFSLPSVLLENGFGTANYFLNHDGFNYSRIFTHPAYGFDKAFFTESFPVGPDARHTSFDKNRNWERADDIDTDEPDWWKSPDWWGEWVDDSDRVWRSNWSWFTPEAKLLHYAIEGGSFLPESDKPFLTYFSTINAHGGYQWRDNLPSVYYQNLAWITANENIFFGYLRQPPFNFNNTQFAHFKMAMARAMVADQGIAYLLWELENRPSRCGTLGKSMADETTILAFSDHNAYMNDLSFNYKRVGRHMSPAFQIPAFLYSPQLAQAVTDGDLDKRLLEVDKFVMHFDLVPTLFNILGIEVNQRMYLGFHAFDERENVVISRLGPASVFNDLFATDGMRVLWRCKSSTEADLVVFRNRYLDMVSRWSYINNIYSPHFW